MIFHDFSITQILREINIGDSGNAKSAISTHFKALNFDFYEFLHFLNAEIATSTKFRAPKMAKSAVLEVQDSPELFSRKI